MMPGMIMLWYGTYATIPSGWSACDGTQGTPNLQLQFVKGAKVAGPGSGHGITGGDFNHSHSFTGDGHAHGFIAGDFVINSYPAGDIDHGTGTAPTSGDTDSEENAPPFMTLFYIMKLPIP